MPRRRSFRLSSEEVHDIFRQVREREERDEPRRRPEAAEREAEISRRASLHPIERLAEDGVKLRKQIESNYDMVAVLEVSRSARAGCRAGDCFYGHRDHSIQDEFRIRVENVRGEWDYYRNMHYYHVLCFEAMMDLEDMIPARKFLCDGNQNWGFGFSIPHGAWGQI